MSIYANKFRPMGIGDIFDEVFDLYKRNFVVLAGISAALYMPLYLASAIVVSQIFPSWTFPTGTPPNPEEFWKGFPILQLIGLGVIWLLDFFAVRPFVTGALCYSIGETYLGRQTTIRQSLSFMWGRFWWYFGTWLLSGLAMLGGGLIIAAVVGAFVAFLFATLPSWAAVLLMLPALAGGMVAGIVLFLWFLFVVPVFVTEGTKYFRALARSRTLISGRYYLGKAFLIVNLVWVLMVVVQQAVVMPVGMLSVMKMPFAGPSPLLMAVQSAIGGVLESVLQPIALCVVVLLYYDARIRKEGFDLQLLAEELQLRSGRDAGAYQAGPLPASGQGGWDRVLGSEPPPPDLGDEPSDSGGPPA